MFNVLKAAKDKLLGLVLLTAMLVPAGAAQAYDTIDVMVLYTSQINSEQNGSIETYINHMVSATNTFYANSNMNVRVRLVHSQEINITGTGQVTSDALSRLRSDATVRSLRSEYGADVVTLLTDPTSSACGIGYVGSGSNGKFSSYAKDYAYNLVGGGSTCSAMTFAHEVGHNISLTHSRAQGDTGGVFGYGLGYGVSGQFSTIMGYPSAFGTRTRIDRFSDPTRSDCLGNACGVNKSAANGADAVSAINSLSAQIADWYPTVVEGGGPGDGSPECLIPSKPSKPVASDIGSSNYTLNWPALEHAVKYQVTRWNSSSRTWQNYSVVEANQALISGVEETVDFPRITGINACGQLGETSDYASITMIDDTPVCTAPAKPAKPVASNIDSSSYTLSWSAVSGAARYRVNRWNESERAWQQVLETSDTQTTISGETGEVAYAHVVAINSCDQAGSASSYVTVNLKKEPIDPGDGDQQNLVKNGDFNSNNLAHWSTYWGGALSLVEQGYTGKAMKVSLRGQWYDGPMQELSEVIKANTSYALSAKVKMAGATDNVKLQIWYYDDAGGHWLAPIEQTAATAWADIEGGFVINNVQGQLKYVRLFVFGPQPNRDFYIDDVIITGR
ncbi:zinc-dependent metalloprotease family protein [Agarivorans aestuarii]|uniref:Zinc-dependent metalloprotease family protein n=1 Tax=Agarivorans aestuarii TaxID=1563703 RepID=A0ABU7G3I8_9ALTE|nr:zinc-dependent metalloprotease family protein [Agarivorans aestuarii]MEE1673749.1 zinc-dependent metalloprotease family protein [Agarivorans aestuarii]